MTRLNRPNPPSFLSGAVLAFVLAIAAAALFASLTPALATPVVVKVIATLLSGSYASYLLCRSAERTGRIVTVAAWCAAAAAVGWLVPGLTLFLIAHVALIWLVRALYFHGSIITGLLDLGLGALALAVAVWAARSSNSVFLASWCFFLVQALFVALPSGAERSAPEASDGDQAFKKAKRSAESALRRLAASI